MSTASDEMRIGEFNGNCFRCGGYGHTADSKNCPLLARARTPAEHEARIREYARRFSENDLSRARKTGFINDENRIWNRRTA